MSTGTRPSSFASIEAGSGGGVAAGIGDGVLDGRGAVGLLAPPHARATRPTAPAAKSDRRETAREKGGGSGDTSESVPLWGGGGSPRRYVLSHQDLTSRYENGFHIDLVTPVNLPRR